MGEWWWCGSDAETKTATGVSGGWPWCAGFGGFLPARSSITRPATVFDTDMHASHNLGHRLAVGKDADGLGESVGHDDLERMVIRWSGIFIPTPCVRYFFRPPSQGGLHHFRSFCEISIIPLCPSVPLIPASPTPRWGGDRVISAPCSIGSWPPTRLGLRAG